MTLTACQRAQPGAAENACAPPGDALVARTLLDQARSALAHADARSSVASLDAGLTKIGRPDLAAPTPLPDDAADKIGALRRQGDTGRLAAVEARVLASRLSDYDRYCGH
jgi:hypothetical protein